VGSIRVLSTDTDLHDTTAQVERNAAPRLLSSARTSLPIRLDEVAGAQVVSQNGPIKHVFYVIKENRTYDQVLGDEKNADGDPKLAIFGRKVTPNEHALAERFGLFDRFFCDGDVSEDGHRWLTLAFANDYLQKTWPPEYGDRRVPYDESPYITESGYLWQNALRHHVSVRDYGEFTSRDEKHGGRWTADVPSMQGLFNPEYAGFDVKVPDMDRIAVWEREFKEFEAHDTLPQLEILWLPTDHTAGTAVGRLTPRAMVAGNDEALGKLVEDISHSKYWSSSVIFVLEDDAQNGPDHVDEQRTTAYVVSPYATGGSHHQHYTQVGVVRSIELILGLPPMTLYDAGAQPLFAAFNSMPTNTTAFDALAPRINVNEMNTARSYGAAVSARFDFSREDAANPALLNNIIMHSVKQ
jgi:hypothetical protein